MNTPPVLFLRIRAVEFQICNSGEVWTSVSAAEAHRIVRKRTGALAKIIRGARKAEKQEAREYRNAERGLQQELREADRRSRALWKRIRVQPGDRPRTVIERKPQAHRATRSGWLAAASQLPRYSGQIIDRAGRAGIFFRVRYYGHGTKAGVGRRATLYIWRGAHETADGRILFKSNVGDTVEEAVAALEAVEMFNREAQAGAKVLFHAIANVPYQLLEMDGGIERMFEIGQRFAEEQFGDRDLPFALALHPPSAEGDQRNWHLHLLSSTRPLVRTGDHEWDIGKMMRREIDNPEAFEVMRHLYARVQTEVVQEAGLNIRYTALSNTERGLPNPAQKHLGPARTARVRRGERDAVNERNWEKSLAGEAALLDEQLRHAQEAAAAGMALIDRVEERAAPLVIAMTTAPALSIAAPLRSVGVISNVAQAAAGIGHDALPTPLALSVANLQSIVRPIATVPAMAAITTVSAITSMPSVSAVRLRQHRLGAIPNVVDRGALDSMPALSVAAITPTPSPSLISTQGRLAGLVAQAAVSRGISLSIGGVRSPADRRILLPKQENALDSDAADRDLAEIFQLLERREAEATAKRERLRRDRLERQRVEAERLRQEQEEERQQREAHALRDVAAHEATEALDAMLNTVEAERILIAFDDDDRCVVDDAVLARFGIAHSTIMSRDAQARLNKIADRQNGEISRLAGHLAIHAGDAVHEPGGWTLSAKAPTDLRRIADLWRHQPALQRSFADTAATLRTERTPMPQAAVPVAAERVPARRGVGPARPGPRMPVASADRQSILALAAAQRDTLTRHWEKGGGLAEMQPASGMAGETKDALTPSNLAKRPFPPDRGQGR